MKIIRALAAMLLVFTGVLHLVYTMQVNFDSTSIITAFFGIAYLLLGTLLFRGGRLVLWFGAIVPLVGFVLAGIGMLMKPTLLGALFMLIDAAVSSCCFLVLVRKTPYRSAT